MPDHYFSQEPSSKQKPAELRLDIKGKEFVFATDAGVFSRLGLDEGSRLLIETAGQLRGRCLDLGCGWGAVGIALATLNAGAQFLLSDINRRAIDLALANIERNRIANARAIESDGFDALSGAFNYIFANPPIRAGKKVIYGLFDTAFEYLPPGGVLAIVIRKQQGAESALKHLSLLFGYTRVKAKNKGYWVIESKKGA
jgi:16S rRNA (guanine1207-N2)-methyltransferase